MSIQNFKHFAKKSLTFPLFIGQKIEIMSSNLCFLPYKSYILT